MCDPKTPISTLDLACRVQRCLEKSFAKTRPPGDFGDAQLAAHVMSYNRQDLVTDDAGTLSGRGIYFEERDFEAARLTPLAAPPTPLMVLAMLLCASVKQLGAWLPRAHSPNL